jgi:hypothetical protein
MSFAFTFLFVSLLVGVLYVHACRKKNRLSATTWQELVGRLAEVPMAGISKMALDYLQPREGQDGLRADEMWLLVGGAKGLERIKANAEILIQLAAFAEEWNLQEGILIGDRMRREGLVLRRAVRKARMGMWFGDGKAKGHLLVQEAASSYFLMRQSLLALYKTSHTGRFGRLSVALGDQMAAYGPAL